MIVSTKNLEMSRHSRSSLLSKGVRFLNQYKYSSCLIPMLSFDFQLLVSRFQLNVHLMEHDSRRCCPHCLRPFALAQHLLAHIAEEHSEVSLLPIPSGPGPVGTPCFIDELVRVGFRKWRRHPFGYRRGEDFMNSLLPCHSGRRGGSIRAQEGGHPTFGKHYRCSHSCSSQTNHKVFSVLIGRLFLNAVAGRLGFFVKFRERKISKGSLTLFFLSKNLC